MPDLLTAFLVIAMVLVVSALASGLVERAPISYPIIFLGLGMLLGDQGVGLIRISPHDPTLEVVGIFTLALVLFLDATKLQVHELGKQWLVPALVLGPGTLMIVGLTAGAAVLLFGLPPTLALMVGAVLASTDPVVLRDVVRDTRLPHSVRQALKIEAGMNDLVVLPILLVLIAIEQARAGSVGEWAVLLARLLLLGPVLGFIVGGLGSWLVGRVDARLSIRREYQALYGIGLVLAAYAVGTAVGGDGFLAAFAAGLAVVVLNQELCDCFMEYGEVTAEMAMLLAFVLFGAVLSTLFATVPMLPSLALAALAILVLRPAVLAAVLARARLSGAARLFIGWFGPRGLNSLLLMLLVVQAGVGEAEFLLAIVGVVVLVSVLVHGASATPLAGWYARKVAREVLNEERESTAAGLFGAEVNDVPRISVDEFDRRLGGPNPPLVLDVRTRSAYERDPAQIPGSIRVVPDQIAEWADRQAFRGPVVTYCA